MSWFSEAIYSLCNGSTAQEPAQIGSSRGAPRLEIPREHTGLREGQTAMDRLHEDPLGLELAQTQFSNGHDDPTAQ